MGHRGPNHLPLISSCDVSPQPPGDGTVQLNRHSSNSCVARGSVLDTSVVVILYNRQEMPPLAALGLSIASFSFTQQCAFSNEHSFNVAPGSGEDSESNMTRNTGPAKHADSSWSSARSTQLEPMDHAEISPRSSVGSRR